MRKTINAARLFLAIGLTSAVMFACKKNANEMPTLTSASSVSGNAQSVMVDVAVTPGFIEENNAYSFSGSTAALRAYFTGTTNIGQLNGAVTANKCNFLNGLPLQNYKHNTQSPLITPVAATNPPAKLTGWSVLSSSTTASTAFAIIIAAESYNSSQDKYSFSIADRVSNLTLTVTDHDGQMVSSQNLTPEYVAEDGATIYNETARFGSAAGQAKLQTGKTIGEIIGLSKRAQHKVVSSGNAGLALASASIPLGEGLYTYTLSGTIKGNSTEGTSNQNFSVTKTINNTGLDNCTLQ